MSSSKEITKLSLRIAENLTSINISASILSIEDQCFSQCFNLSSISVDSDNLQFASLDGILFSKNFQMLLCFPSSHQFFSYIIPTSVSLIGNSAFSYCSNLRSIIIPSSVTSIGKSAFYRCSNLQTITIPANVTSIGETVFTGCSNLQTIIVESNNLNYASQDGIFFTKDFQRLICFPSKHPFSTYTIPASVKSIDDSAFYECQTLRSITIPSGVTSIGDSLHFMNVGWNF